MTSEETQKIKVLRYRGGGYGKIARAIALSRDSIRSYCTRAGLNGYAIRVSGEIPLVK